MKPPVNSKAFRVAGLVALLVIVTAAFNYSLSLKRRQAEVSSRQREFDVLKEEFRLLKAKIAVVEGRKSPAGVEGIVQAVDEIFRTLGLSQKVKSVKPTASHDVKNALEEEAEIRIEKATLNEAVNILYRIENAPMPLLIRKTTIKSSFENQSLLDMTLTVGLIKPR